FAVQSCHFACRGNCLVKLDLEHHGAWIVIPGLLVAVDHELRRGLDGEVDAIVLIDLPPVAVGKTESAQDTQSTGLGRPHAIFVSDALVGNDDDGPCRVVKFTLEHAARPVQGDDAANATSHLGRQVVLAQVIVSDPGTCSGVVVDIDSAPYVV